jgi:flagellar assembly factor FliW
MTATTGAMKITTRVLGEIELTDEQIVDMPSGMIGFPGRLRYALIPFADAKVPFLYWQCIDDLSLCFILIDPTLIDPGYTISLPADQLEEIELTSTEEGSVYAVVTVPADPRELTANLMGPIVINKSARKARQLVLTDARYSTRHRVLRREAPDDARADSQAG